MPCAGDAGRKPFKRGKGRRKRALGVREGAGCGKRPDLEQALILLHQLKNEAPEPAGVERLRGTTSDQQEKFPEAVAAFTKAADQDPKDRESVEMLGVSLFRMGRASEALPFLEKAHLAVERANIDPQYVLGLCYADMERYADARHAFAAQYGFAPDSAAAYLLAARLFLRREFAAEAVVEARKALETQSRAALGAPVIGRGRAGHGRHSRRDSGAGGRAQDRSAEWSDVRPARRCTYATSNMPRRSRHSNCALLLEPSATAPYILLGQVFIKLRQPIQALHYPGPGGEDGPLELYHAQFAWPGLQSNRPNG